MKHKTALKIAVCSTAFLLGTAFNTSSNHRFTIPSLKTSLVHADDFSDVRIQQHVYFDPSYKAQDVLNWYLKLGQSQDQAINNHLDEASVKSMESGKNVYQDSPADENDRVYNGQPNARQNLELNIYTLNLLNGIYKQLGLNRQLVLNRSAMQMEQNLAKEYQKDNWTIEKADHDERAIHTTDSQYEPYGSEVCLGGNRTYKTINNLNMNDYKKTIYNSILGMLFGNAQGPAIGKVLHNKIGDGEYSHAAGLLGYGNTPNGIKYIGKYFAISTQFDQNINLGSYNGKDLGTSNFITIHYSLNPDDIAGPAGQPSKFNKNDNVTDTTEHFSSPSRIAQYKQYLVNKKNQHKQQLQDQINAQNQQRAQANERAKEQAEKQAQKFNNGNNAIDSMIMGDINNSAKKSTNNHHVATTNTATPAKHHKRVAKKHATKKHSRKKRVTHKRRKRTRKVKTRKSRKRVVRKRRKRVVRRHKKRARRKTRKAKVRKRNKKRATHKRKHSRKHLLA